LKARCPVSIFPRTRGQLAGRPNNGVKPWANRASPGALLICLVALAPADAGEHSGFRPAVYRVTSLVAGDVACYLEYEDARGRQRRAMADFSLCDRAAELINRRVRFRHAQGRVMADSCEGNPDCADTKTVSLIVDALPADAGTAPASGK
jgi:hypothetical protein